LRDNPVNLWTAKVLTPEVKKVVPVSISTSSLMAMTLGLGVFLVLVAVGWRSVQNRRILRVRGVDGQETIIVAGQDDIVSSIVTTTEVSQPAPAAAPTPLVHASAAADPELAPEFGRKAG
jgi:hypothetical protein